jgi:hypothetical protein
MREFCSVDLANWLREQNVYFCLRLKRNHCIETENMIWVRLDQLGIKPGTSLYFQGIKVRKTKPLAGFDVACKWKRNYQGWTVDEAWFILTNLGDLPQAIAAYKQRMGIEEMFRDCKSGGYNLEGTGLTGDRLIKIILLMTISYSYDIIEGSIIKEKMYKNMFLVARNPKELIADVVHSGLGMIANSGLIISKNMLNL